jgi:UDP-2-acetamido-2,6-beta-L-arabino-hexul-4-ose reductase
MTKQAVCRVLVTGSNGFIGKNLIIKLNELASYSVEHFVRGDEVAKLYTLVAQVDVVVHLAGENRPTNESFFHKANAGLTAMLCDAIRQEKDRAGRNVHLVLASSTQADEDNAYGLSKRAAEKLVENLAEDVGNSVSIFRLPGVFGKWCKPNYNSVVATFCHNISRGLPIKINDPAVSLRLVYIDDAVSALVMALQDLYCGTKRCEVQPEYHIKIGELADQIEIFKNCRTSLMVERVGNGFARALYATYLSYVPHNNFSYEIPQYKDSRGIFVEMLKTPDCGQFSYFTAHPGATRGNHYHHTKTEKFLVLKGKALFYFKNLITNEVIELYSSGDEPKVVDTIPGWVHSITNVGEDDMVAMLWSSENFDLDNPDTIASKV